MLRLAPVSMFCLLGACTFDVSGLELDDNPPDAISADRGQREVGSQDSGVQDKNVQPKLDKPTKLPDKSVPPPPVDKGPPPDKPLTSWYGQFCESVNVGKLCPDGKTICRAAPTGKGGICTHSCEGKKACPAGPAGTNVGCGDFGGGRYCHFICYRDLRWWPCPSSKLTCKFFSWRESHCWP